jgi:hypothetical protein
MLWARILGNELYVAYRTGYKNIRDMHLLRGKKSANDFRDILVSPDNWELEGCPMSGPRFVVGPYPYRSVLDGFAFRVLLSWMSDGKVYWSFYDYGGLEGIGPGTPLAPRIPAPDGGAGNYPTIVTNSQGNILLVWTRDGKVQWATYEGVRRPGPVAAEHSKVTAKPTLIARGTAGAANGRPTAFVRPDGTFAIVP